jgi:proline racemase
VPVRSRRIIHVVDSHTEGMPTRVVTGGIGVVPGATMAEKRLYFMQNLDHLRTLLMYEPHGHPAMSGAILQPPTVAGADYGVIFIEVSGCLPMCGHGTIGVATVLVETGMVEAVEPMTIVRLDTPAGLVSAQVEVRDGRAVSVTIQNVPSFVVGLDREIDGLPYDLAYGGNFYAIVRLADLGLTLESPKQALLDRALEIMAGINKEGEPVHPEDPSIRGCHHIYLAAQGSDARHSRHAMAIHPGWFDRSPCGTGTSARMAQLHARGELPLDTDFINQSLLGTHFVGRLIGELSVGGQPAVVPTIKGRAWLTGTAQHFVDPDDPFPAGFLL